jgi:hypothetical protein
VHTLSPQPAPSPLTRVCPLLPCCPAALQMVALSEAYFQVYESKAVVEGKVGQHKQGQKKQGQQGKQQAKQQGNSGKAAGQQKQQQVQQKQAQQQNNGS